MKILSVASSRLGHSQAESRSVRQSPRPYSHHAQWSRSAQRRCGVSRSDGPGRTTTVLNLERQIQPGWLWWPREALRCDSRLRSPISRFASIPAGLTAADQRLSGRGPAAVPAAAEYPQEERVDSPKGDSGTGRRGRASLRAARVAGRVRLHARPRGPEARLQVPHRVPAPQANEELQERGPPALRSPAPPTRAGRMMLLAQEAPPIPHGVSNFHDEQRPSRPGGPAADARRGGR